jgi:single-stranded DNA-binding protein
MVTVNVVVLAGRLSADPEIAEMPSGDTVARLRLQVPEAGKRVLPSRWRPGTVPHAAAASA